MSEKNEIIILIGFLENHHHYIRTIKFVLKNIVTERKTDEL